MGRKSGRNCRKFTFSNLSSSCQRRSIGHCVGYLPGGQALWWPLLGEGGSKEIRDSVARNLCCRNEKSSVGLGFYQGYVMRGDSASLTTEKFKILKISGWLRFFFKTHAALKLSLKDCLPNSHLCPSLPETVRCNPGLLRWQKRPNPKNGDREIVSSLSLPNMSAAPTGHQVRQKKKWNKKEKLRVSWAEWPFPGVSPKSLANRVQPYV